MKEHDNLHDLLGEASSKGNIETCSLEENISVLIRTLLSTKSSYMARDLRSKLNIEEKRLQALLKSLQTAQVQRKQLTQRMCMLKKALQQGPADNLALTILPLNVPRPIPPPGDSARPDASVSLYAIPAPELWDSAWIERLKRLRPVDFTLLHKQHIEHIHPLVLQVIKRRLFLLAQGRLDRC